MFTAKTVDWLISHPEYDEDRHYRRISSAIAMYKRFIANSPEHERVPAWKHAITMLQRQYSSDAYLGVSRAAHKAKVELAKAMKAKQPWSTIKR